MASSEQQEPCGCLQLGKELAELRKATSKRADTVAGRLMKEGGLNLFPDGHPRIAGHIPGLASGEV